MSNFQKLSNGAPRGTQVSFTDLGGSATATQMPAFSGDITTTAGSTATTLATVNTNVGSFTNASVTVNAKGLVTAISSGSAPLTNPMTTLGDIIYGGVSGVATKLNGSTSTTIAVLTQTGTGSASAAPGWITTTGTNKVVMSTAPLFDSTIGFSASSAFSAGTIQKSAADGLLLSGITGTTYDFAYASHAGTELLANPTGSNNLLIVPGGGQVTLGSTANPSATTQMLVIQGPLATNANQSGLFVKSGTTSGDFNSIFASANNGTNFLIIDGVGTATFGGTVRMQGTSGATIGIGGTANNSNGQLNLNGSSASGQGAAITFQSASGTIAGIGRAGALQGSTSNDLLISSNANNIKLNPGGSLALTLDTSQNATFAGSAGINGTLAIGTTPVTGSSLYILSTNLAGSAQTGIQINPTFTSSGTSLLFGIRSNIATQASAGFTAAFATDFAALAAVIGSGSAITNHVGFFCSASGGANVSQISDNQVATGNWFINQSGTAASTFGGPVTVKHLLGGGSAPTIVAGTGAGTAPTIGVGGTDTAGQIVLTTGTTPSANATICTLTFSTAFSATPNSFIFSPSNAAAAALFGPSSIFITGNNATLILNSGTTAIGAATQFKWNYLVVG